MRNHLHVIHQALAWPEQKKLQRIRRALAVIQHARPFHGRPTALRAFIAVRPRKSKPRITARINPLQTAPAAIGPQSPAPAGPVRHFVNNDANRVGEKNAEVVGLDPFLGTRERNPFTAVRKAPIILAEDHCMVHAGIIRIELRAIFCDDQIAIPWQHRAVRKLITDPST